MSRLFVFFLLAGLAFTVMAVQEEMNSTDAYLVREYALISFADESGQAEPANITEEEVPASKTENQTRRGGEMTARKLFQLKQAAKEGSEIVPNKTGSSSQKSSATCVGCTKTTGFGTFRL